MTKSCQANITMENFNYEYDEIMTHIYLLAPYMPTVQASSDLVLWTV